MHKNGVAEGSSALSHPQRWHQQQCDSVTEGDAYTEHCHLQAELLSFSMQSFVWEGDSVKAQTVRIPACNAGRPVFHPQILNIFSEKRMSNSGAAENGQY